MFDEIQGKLINSMQCSVRTAYLLSRFYTYLQSKHNGHCQLQNCKEHTCTFVICEIRHTSFI